MTHAPAEREPSAWPLGGYWFAMLVAGVPALLASGAVYSIALPLRAESGVADGILTLALASVPLIAMFVFYRSSRRHGYAASPGLAVALVVFIWAGAWIGAVLNSFEDIYSTGVDPAQIEPVRHLSESLLGGSVGLLTLNIVCALGLNAEDWPGRAARIGFIGSASLWGALIVAPAITGMLTGG